MFLLDYCRRMCYRKLGQIGLQYRMPHVEMRKQKVKKGGRRCLFGGIESEGK